MFRCKVKKKVKRSTQDLRCESESVSRVLLLLLLLDEAGRFSVLAVWLFELEASVSGTVRVGPEEVAGSS